MSKDKERQAFEEALKENRYDEACHKIFADWLDEHDQPEEADWHRKWTKERQEAEDWMRDFASKCGVHCTNYSEYCDKVHKAYEEWRAAGRPEGGPNLEGVEENLVPITYEMVMEAATQYVDSEGEEWFTQMGSEEARDMMFSAEVRKRFWECWELLTGRKPLSGEDEWEMPLDRGPFSCSC